MPQSNEIGELAGALAKAQAAMKVAPLNKTNPHFKNKYADLPSVIDAIRKPLTENGIALTQTTELRDGAFCLVTRLIHSSGQWMSGEYLLPAQATPQQLGSALTYARRYSLSAIACIAADEDDDAEGARKEGHVAAMPKRDNPHVTQPEDIVDFQVRRNERGDLIDCIPMEGIRVPKMKVEDARKAAKILNHAFDLCETEADLVAWGEENAETIASFSDKWMMMYQGRYQMRLDELRKQKKAA
jgi:hypothetical protein